MEKDSSVSISVESSVQWRQVLGRSNALHENDFHELMSYASDEQVLAVCDRALRVGWQQVAQHFAEGELNEARSVGSLVSDTCGFLAELRAELGQDGDR